MQQSIEVLMLPLTELNLCIDQELQENPLLEIDEEKLHTQQEQQKDELLRIIDYAKSSIIRQNRDQSSDDEPFEERPIKMESSLEDELLRQLRVELSDPLEIQIGEYIIGNLDEDGYLTTTCEEIAQALGPVDAIRVQYILKIIQNFEPAGIASRNLRECLLAQVYMRCNGKSELVRTIIEHHLDELGHRKFQDIARKTKASLDEVKEAAQKIASFEPKPARNYRPIKTNLYIKPDIYIVKDDDDQYHVRVNSESNPPLRINLHYQRMLAQKNLKQDEKLFIRERLKNALQFIKSIEQRGQTIVRITEYILEKQKDFFENGHMSLAPMTLKDIAQEIDRNESTISRAITNKYVDTPRGLFPLKFFFSQGVSDNASGIVASRSIKEEIKELVDAEDKTAPLSDQSIQDYFKRKNVDVARRTISKYRQKLNILPSHLRKN